jgi:hypothetical protein
MSPHLPDESHIPENPRKKNAPLIWGTTFHGSQIEFSAQTQWLSMVS